MLFDQITGDLAKGITFLQGEERREDETQKGRRGRCGLGILDSGRRACLQLKARWLKNVGPLGGGLRKHKEEERRGEFRSFFCLGRWSHSSSPPWPGFLEMAVN